MKIRSVFLSLVATFMLAITALLSPAVAQTSQEVTSLKNVVLSVYPEYDDLLGLGYPSVLVMVDGEIVGAAPPATIRFLVPSNATMYSAGSGPRDLYVGGPPNRKPSDIEGWDEISYELKTKYFVVEYYVPIEGQPTRTFTYDFRRLYPVSDLVLMVQEPRRSSNFTISPQGPTHRDNQGFAMRSYNYANLAVDAPVRFDIGYTKSDLLPSLASAGGSVNVPLLLGLIGVPVLVVAFVWVSKSRARSRAAARRAARSRPGRVAPRSQANQAKSRFCTQCGSPVHGSARFCTKCGNKTDSSA